MPVFSVVLLLRSHRAFFNRPLPQPQDLVVSLAKARQTLRTGTLNHSRRGAAEFLAPLGCLVERSGSTGNRLCFFGFGLCLLILVVKYFLCTSSSASVVRFYGDRSCH